MRKQLNKATGNILSVETKDKEKYIFYLMKKTYKTRVYGKEYNKFLKDFNMNPYDKVKLEFRNNYLRIDPKDNEGNPKERVKGKFVFRIINLTLFYVCFFYSKESLEFFFHHRKLCLRGSSNSRCV